MKWFQNRKKKLAEQKRKLDRVFNRQDTNIIVDPIIPQYINNELPSETTKEYPSESAPSYEGGGGEFGGGGASSSYTVEVSDVGGDCSCGDGGGGGGD